MAGANAEKKEKLRRIKKYFKHYLHACIFFAIVLNFLLYIKVCEENDSVVKNLDELHDLISKQVYNNDLLSSNKKTTDIRKKLISILKDVKYRNKKILQKINFIADAAKGAVKIRFISLKNNLIYLEGETKSKHLIKLFASKILLENYLHSILISDKKNNKLQFQLQMSDSGISTS